MKEVLNTIYNQQFLSEQIAYETMCAMGKGEVAEAQIAALVSALNMRPLHVDELAGFRRAMLELATPIDLEGRTTIDIVGTGGDGKNTFNISTLSCVVVAGAGYAVTKHGSYGVSSSVGSSDVLIEMGYQFTNERDELLKRLDRCGIVFLHAPLFHPAMKQVVPTRKALQVKTFFNVMGPLINPAKPAYQLFGTFSLGLARTYQYLLQNEQERRYRIIHARDGYDEVSLTGATEIRDQSGQSVLDPKDFGLSPTRPESLHGGDTAAEGAAIFQSVLENRATQAQLDVVCANAALAIQLFKPTQGLKDCVAEARESVESGRAKKVWEKLLTT
ncbi:MAG: anthranilate phosphoribosyltransferase [Bacteroidota bacterium]